MKKAHYVKSMSNREKPVIQEKMTVTPEGSASGKLHFTFPQTTVHRITVMFSDHISPHRGSDAVSSPAASISRTASGICATVSPDSIDTADIFS